MSNHKKIDPFSVPLESLQAYINRCRDELKKPLLDDVRATTEQSLKTLETILQSRLNMEEPDIQPRPELKGIGRDLEQDWMKKEAQLYSGQVSVTERKGEFYALMPFGDTFEELAENTIISRITASVANFIASKRHRLGMQQEILTLRGFDTLTNYVQALRFVKYNKCRYYGIEFTELNIKDIYKFSRVTESKKFYINHAIERAVSLVPA